MTDTSMKNVALTIDGQSINVPEGTTIFDAAALTGISIPALCHRPGLRPVGVCRTCVVEVEGARVLQASCVRQVEDGMIVYTDTERVRAVRKTIVELLLADYSQTRHPGHLEHPDELIALAKEVGLGESRFPASRSEHPQDSSSEVIMVDHGACILCDRCIRACDEIQCNDVIGRMGKGFDARICFDDDQPMGKSTCVSCGECAAACPTGALVDKPIMTSLPPETELKHVDSLCPYCGVGCSIRYSVHEESNTIIRADGRESPVNQGRLCVKGRYGFDYTHHSDRLTVPLIRKEDAYPKSVDLMDDPRAAFREASWDEALDLAAGRFKAIKENHGSQAMAGFGSAKCSNEDGYLFQKLIRAVFGTNNVDHCTRLCHASSVAALVQQLGSGSVSNPFSDCLLADTILITGSNTTENHPVAATFMKQAARNGSTLFVIDPRRPDIANHADLYIRINPGTDVAFYNAVMHVILAENLQDNAFIESRTENIEELKRVVSTYSPAVSARICGIPEDYIVRVARACGGGNKSMIFWGMGISQHTHGTDNARCLINLALLTGNIGKPGTGLHPLRGQNNVQGASDVGLIPMFYPGYQDVEDQGEIDRFETAWGVPLDHKTGLTVVEIMSAARSGDIKAMYMLGENPFLSDPNINKVKQALAKLNLLVVQDIFMTETASYADIILPGTSFYEKTGIFVNTDSRAQLGRKVINPPGKARSDWRIVADISGRMGYPMDYESEEEIWNEVTSLTPAFSCITYERVETRPVPWPCKHPEDEGTLIRFTESFPRGRGLFAPAEFKDAAELPDETYPLILNTGRVLQHWHTGTMTRRSKALDAIAPEARIEMTSLDMKELGIVNGELVTVRSRRGSITARVLETNKPSEGSIFIPFHFVEAAANLLTNDVLDPDGKIPEFKFCAVKVEKRKSNAI